MPRHSSGDDANPSSSTRAGLAPNHDLDILIQRRQQVHQAFGDEITIPPGSPDAGRGFLLERVEDVHGVLESNRVYRAIGVSVVRLDLVSHARTESLPGLRSRRSSAELRDAEGVSHVLLDRRGKAQEIAFGRRDPVQRFLVGGQAMSHRGIIPVLG